MNATHKQLLRHAFQRVHRTGHVGMVLAIMSLIHGGGAWLVICGHSYRLNALVVIVPSLAWSLLFSGGRKSLTSLPITLHQYEVSRWWFVFVLPALFFSGITVSVFVTSAWLGAQPSAAQFWAYLFYILGLLGLLAALTNTDMIQSSEPLRFGYVKSNVGGIISSAVVVCAMIGLPVQGHWIAVVLVAAILGLILGISYPLARSMSWLRSPSSPINRSVRDLSSLLGFRGGAISFLLSHAMNAAVSAGLLIAAFHFLIPAKFIAKSGIATSFAAPLTIMWLAHFYALGNLRAFRLLPISLTSFAVALLAFSWLPTLFLYLFASCFPHNTTAGFYSLLTSCALITSVQGLIVPTLIKNYDTRFGWPALPRGLWIALVHSLIGGVIAPRLAERIDPIVLAALFLCIGYFSVASIRRALSSAQVVYQT